MAQKTPSVDHGRAFPRYEHNTMQIYKFREKHLFSKKIYWFWLETIHSPQLKIILIKKVYKLKVKASRENPDIKNIQPTPERETIINVAWNLLKTRFHPFNKCCCTSFKYGHGGSRYLCKEYGRLLARLPEDYSAKKTAISYAMLRHTIPPAEPAVSGEYQWAGSSPSVSSWQDPLSHP